MSLEQVNLHIGPVTTPTGGPVLFIARVACTVPVLVHEGAVIFAGAQQSGAPSAPVVVSVPVVGQDGVTDPAGNPVADWAYVISVETGQGVATQVIRPTTGGDITAFGRVALVPGGGMDPGTGEHYDVVDRGDGTATLTADQITEHGDGTATITIGD